MTSVRPDVVQTREVSRAAAQSLAIPFMNVFSNPIAETDRIGDAARAGLLATVSRLPPHEACSKLGSALEGLSGTEAAARLKKYGPNLVARERKATIAEELWSRARNPLNALLLTLATVSYFSGDVRAAVVIAAMVVLAITTAFIQEHRSNDAAARLRAMVHTTASVRRSPCPPGDPFSEIPMDDLVPGDVVRLSAGDMIPADLRLLEAKDLFINQSALTGESMPAEKHAEASTHRLRRRIRAAERLLHGSKCRVRIRHRRCPADGFDNVLRPACSRDCRTARSDCLRPRASTDSPG